VFNLQGSELIIIVLLALVVLGPEKLPDAMRKLGQFYAELKKMSSGFQQEFRSVVDEPLKEIRDTANLLRDSADFTKLQDGDRGEKPKSAEMAPADPAVVPTDDVPFTDAAAATDEDAIVDPEPPRPFSGSQLSSAAPRPVEPTAIPAPPLPFATQAPVPIDSTEPGAPDDAVTDDAVTEPGAPDDAVTEPGAPDDAVTDDDALVDVGPDEPASAEQSLDETPEPTPGRSDEPRAESGTESGEEAATADSSTAQNGHPGAASPEDRAG
jgi:sec-independent protein translocase protein TatB